MWWRKTPRSATPTQSFTDRHPFKFVQKGHVLSAAAYELPRDPEEVSRQDFQHYLFRYMLHANVLAPVRNPLGILDVGCGTGLWAKEVATQFPNANIIGMDIAPQSASKEQVVANYTFIQADLLEGLPFHADSFDYIHQRVLVLGIPTDKWLTATRELARVAEPNGWIELCEPSYGFGAPALETMFAWMGALAKMRNIDVGIVRYLGDFLQQAHLRSVRSHRVDIPVGEHGGRIGRWCGTDVHAIFKGLRQPLIGTKITTEQEFDTTLMRFQAELHTHRGFIPYFVAYGQKPGIRA